MKPETAAYFNDMQRRLQRDPRALEKEFAQRVEQMFGLPKDLPTPKEPEDAK